MLKPLLILALLSTLAHARIGETPEQCAKRYGEPFERKGGNATAIHSFAKGGVMTTCYFTGDKCVAICFELMAPVRADLQDSMQNTTHFTAEQSATLLAANKGESDWATLETHRGITRHVTKDGTRHAVTSESHVIIQTTQDMGARLKLVVPDAVSKAIEGF